MSNKIKPVLDSSEKAESDSLNSSYLKLRPFEKLDPTLVRLLRFLSVFGLTADFASQKSPHQTGRSYGMVLRMILMLAIGFMSGEVVYDVNLRQSKLLAEQKRSTPLLTFVIVAYSWLTIIIPIICDFSLLMMGDHLFRFYSRTTATICNGMFFGKRTSVDSFGYYFILILLALVDANAQLVVLGVWTSFADPYIRLLFNQPSSVVDGTVNALVVRVINNTMKNTGILPIPMNDTMHHDIGLDMNLSKPRVRAYMLDFILGDTYAHNDIGIMIKVLCLMIQFFHSYAFLLIIVSFANHYAAAINNINENLDKYEFRGLLKQLIIFRDSSEQISIMISIPFAFITILVFMRQIALNGVFIQSTMQPYENWAVSLQAVTSTLSILMVYNYCDGLQSASKQTHRLKTEQTVVNDNRGSNQSIYEFLDYLNRLSKSIRITFFNIIAINKSSLVGLYGHILTLTFVTS